MPRSSSSIFCSPIVNGFMMMMMMKSGEGQRAPVCMLARVQQDEQKKTPPFVAYSFSFFNKRASPHPSAALSPACSAYHDRARARADCCLRRQLTPG